MTYNGWYVIKQPTNLFSWTILCMFKKKQNKTKKQTKKNVDQKLSKLALASWLYHLICSTVHNSLIKFQNLIFKTFRIQSRYILITSCIYRHINISLSPTLSVPVYIYIYIYIYISSSSSRMESKDFPHSFFPSVPIIHCSRLVILTT